MTNDKIRELKRELAEAEAKANAEAAAAELAEAKEKLENRAYYFNRDNKRWVSANIVLFGKVKRGGFGKLEVSSRKIIVTRYAKPLPGFDISVGCDRYDRSFDSVAQLLLDSRGEIPKSVFMRMYKESENLGDCCMKWLTRVFENPATEPWEDEDKLGESEAELGVDLPCLELDAGDAYILPRRYFLSGRRYVLSGGSIAAGLKKLDDEERWLRQGSHLYEACDMGYVNTRTRQILDLRQMLLGADKQCAVYAVERMKGKQDA